MTPTKFIPYGMRRVRLRRREEEAKGTNDKVNSKTSEAKL
jgi:hypothetical protein